VGDGYKGWPEKAPFDAIVLTAAAPEIPEPLKQQLKIGGRLIAPVGESAQQLILLEKIAEDNFEEKVLLPVKFVPMTGEAQKGPQ
jgi:protein-L-isoaspartate(D-aspartate) O-methyltransferase